MSRVSDVLPANCFSSTQTNGLFLALFVFIYAAIPIHATNVTFRNPLQANTTSLRSADLEHVLEAFASLPDLPDRPFIPLDIVWQYAAGSPGEGPKPSIELKPALLESVRTPHSILKPDTPFWYEAIIDVESAAVFRISGNDGAQVFVDDKPVHAFASELYRILPDSGRRLTIRVINNAMAGGLRRVEHTSAQHYEMWTAARSRRSRLQHLVKKLALLESAPARAEGIGAVLTALREPSVDNIDRAESALARWPFPKIQPIVQEPARGEMSILWEMDRPGRAFLEWTVAPREAEPPLPNAPPAHRREIHSADGLFETTIHSLADDLVVSYRIRQEETTSPLYAFNTRESRPDFRFAVWADSQGGWSTFAGLVEKMHAMRPAFTVGVGDLVSNGSIAGQWISFFAALQPLASTTPCFLVPGNHDYDGCYDEFEPVLFNRYARSGTGSSGRKNYYAWTWQNARLVALDLNATFPISIPEGGDQYSWLMREIKSPEWQRADWRFIFVHQPCYSQGWPGYQGEIGLRNFLDRLADQAAIDFIVSGHTHDYERLRRSRMGGDVHHIIVGGAGGGLEPPDSGPTPVTMDKVIKEHHFGMFEVSGRTVRFTMVDHTGRKRDSFTVSK